MDTSTEMLITVLRSRMGKMTDYERLALVEGLMENYCVYCGSAFLPCWCTNDS